MRIGNVGVSPGLRYPESRLDMKPARAGRLFVIGAGASYAVGLPDAARVLTQLTLYTSGPYGMVQNRTPMALLADVTGSLIRFAQETGVTKGDRFPLDAMAARFYATWRENPNFGMVVMAFWQALCEFMYERSAERAPEYRRFANSLAPGDIVISFNWDTCLEMALLQAKRPFTVSLEPRTASGKIRVLKPHGSVDFAIADGPAPGCPRRRFIEMIHPAMPGIQTPAGYKQPRLYRLLTYDLGFRVRLAWRGRAVDLRISKRQPSDAAGAALRPRTSTRTTADRLRPRRGEPKSATTSYGSFAYLGPDVGPLHLRGFLLESMPYLLTPGSPQPWYDWSYSCVRRIVESAGPLRAIFVAGYSFPPYDGGVRALLTGLSRPTKPVPVHIINPAARELPKDVLDSMFPRYELHACGFLDYKWRKP